MKLRLMRTVIGSAGISTLAMIAASSAWAQEVTTPAAEAADEAPEQAIVVTGSRIARPDLDSTVPLAIVAGDQFIKQGNTNIGDTLNDLPQLRATRGQQNSNLGVGISGLNLLDLRGLGTVRTLVLVNGRRHVGSDILSNAVSVDTNTIPANMIERVDIVTGGNSAVYGSDAIAGVVNFVLKRNFEGVELAAKGGISTPGGYGGTQNMSAIVGKNFNDGRGNVTLSVEYNHQDKVFGSDIPFLSQVDGLLSVDLDVSGSDGNPDRTYFFDQRSSSIHRYGLVPITQRAANPVCGTGISNGVTAGIPYNCNLIFQPDGSLAPQTGSRVGTGVLGTFIGGNGQTGREGQLITILPRQDIVNANLVAHYEFSPAFDVFFEGKYARIISNGGNAGPAAVQGTFVQFDYRERFRLDNPFLSADARNQIASAIIASGCNPSFTAACSTATDNARDSQGALTAAQIAKINNGTYRFAVGRNLLDLGIRNERFQRETVRAVLGVRGTFNDDWKYEVAANYGRFTEHTDASGYVDKQRFMLSLDAGRNPATGAIECRAKFDPASAVAFANTAGYTSKLAADIAACVPYNPFGAANNDAAARYFGVIYNNDSMMEQIDFSGYVSGDTSGFFNLPGGPVSVVLGGEYREERARYNQDAFSAGGFTNAVAFGGFNPAPFKVTEGFAEVNVPVLRDVPFFHALTLSGAARVSKYQGGTGTVWAYNYGGEWAPIQDIRFRANVGRAVRAPNLSETSSPLVPNFAPAFTDPCSDSRRGSGTQFRAANCLADLNSAEIAAISAKGGYSLPIISGSDPNLRAETSDSLTIGAVIQPSMIRGLSLTVDYYNIRVKDVIVSLSAQTIANSCYDQPTLANPFCALFRRFRGPGTGPFGEAAGEIQGNTLISSPFNFARRVRRGIDTQLTYRTSWGADWKAQGSVLWVHNLTNSNFENPSIPTFENRILGELGDPIDEVQFSLDVTKGPFTLGYQMRYIGKMWVNAYEDFNPLQDRAAQDADWADIQKYPAVFYHDIRAEFDLDKAGIAKNFNFYMGVDNVFNVIPPLGVTATGERVANGGTGSPIYSVRGRQLYAGIRAKF